MSFTKNKKHIDPESTDWLFDQNDIQFIVNENGFDIQADAGFRYLEENESDSDFLHIESDSDFLHIVLNKIKGYHAPRLSLQIL